MIAKDDKLLNVSVGQVVRKFWPTVRPYRWKFALGVALIITTTAIEIALPVVTGKTVDAAIAGAGLRDHLIFLCLLYLGGIFFKSIFDSWQAYVIQATGQQITQELRMVLFSRLERLTVSFFDRNPTGRLVTRVVNDIKSLSELFTASISVLALDLLVIIGTIVAMFLLHWKLALAVLLTFPIVVATIQIFGMKLAIAYRKVRQQLSAINAFLGENIGAIATIQRLAAEETRYEKFENIVAKHQDAQMESLRVFATVQPIANVVNGIAMSTLVILGGHWVIEGTMSIGVIVAFLGYQRNLFNPVRDLVEKYNTFLSSLVAGERVVTLLEEQTEDEAIPVVKPTEPLSFFSGGVGPEIRFENVTFQYATREQPAIEHINFTVPGGSSLAVVGATGSGKSTLIRLLLRFYEPNQGDIYFAGRNLKEWSRESLRRQIGVVHQEIYLFQGTVRNNLTLERGDFTDAYLIEQCKRAQLWDFIRHRGGLDMPVLEGGTNFSLGERQLLSFARILVLDAPVLILDEATSSVDRISEKKLMNAVREVIAGRTSIVIAHRLSTIKECDRVLVFDHGELKEEGTYDELLRLKGIFRKFHDIHF